jgi:hypothetical protein
VGVTASLALLRVHVLVVELPGRPMLRLRAEAAVRARGWVPVAEPADADLVLVCGTPVPSVVEAVDALWWRVPAPRVRRTVRSAEALQEALDSATRVLADTALQRSAADPDAPPPRGSADPDRHAVSGGSRTARRLGTADPRTARFGPVGPDWPAGLQLDCSAGADGRIVAVGVRLHAVSGDDEDVPERVLLLAVADAARLLRRTGWAAPALRLDRVVDLVLGGAPPDRVRRRLRSVAGAVRRSATFRWTAGDPVRDRVLALLASAVDGTAPPAPPERRLVGAQLADVPVLVALTEPVDG